jgi:hypothetical protein
MALCGQDLVNLFPEAASGNVWIPLMQQEQTQKLIVLPSHHTDGDMWRKVQILPLTHSLIQKIKLLPLAGLRQRLQHWI